MFIASWHVGAIECGHDVWPRTQHAGWGDDWYVDVAGMSLVMPGDEYLASEWIGEECRQQGDEFIMGSRFAVKSDAILGAIVRKLGCSDRMQEYLDNIRYRLMQSPVRVLSA